jgi:VCBS repeat-containing protein
MVLNEMVYDPNGTANSSVVSLVQGTISFVAGQVAKTGDMQVQTPVATMGIRGTIVIVEISANNGPTKISSVFDPNTGRVGEIVAWENGNRSNVLATIASEDRAVLFTPQLNQQPIVTEIPRTAADQLAAQNVVQQVLAIQTAFNAQPFQAGQQYTPPPSDPGTGPSGPATGGGAGGSSSAPTDNLATQGGTQATTLVGSLTPPPPPDPNIPQNATFAATTLTGGSSGGGTGGSATQNGSSGPPVLDPDSVASHSPNGGSGSTGDGATGGLTFTDPDSGDTHTASSTLNANALAWTKSGAQIGLPIPVATLSALADAFSAAIETAASGGNSGAIRWQFSLPSGLTAFLGADDTLIVPYQVRVTDSAGNTSVQTVSILLTGTNDAPTVALDSTSPHPLSELAGITGAVDDRSVTGTLAFDDVDLADAHQAIASLSVLTWTRSDGSSATGVFPQATLDALRAAILLGGQDSTGNAVGSLTWTFSVADTLFDFLAANERLTIVYEIGVDDGQGGRVTQPVTIVVTGTNDGPVFAAGVVTGGTETETTLTVTGQIAFSDPDRGDIHIASAAATAGTFGTLTAAVTVDSTGTGSGGVVGWFYQADQAFVRALAEGEIKSDSFIVTLGDDKGQTTTETVTVTFVGENDAPTVSGPVTGEATEDGVPVQLNALAKATDVDHDTVLRVVLPSELPAGVSFDAATNIFSLDASNAAYQHLGAGQSTIVTVSYGVSDGFVTTAATASWEVFGANDGPAAAADTGTAGENETKSLAVLANDTDPDTGDTKTLVSLGTILVGGAAASPGQAGAFSIVNNEIRFAGAAFDYLGVGQSATVVVNYVMADGSGAQSNSTLTLTITGTNDPTVLISTNSTGATTTGTESAGNSSAQDIGPLGGSLSFSDADVGDSLSASAGTPILKLNGDSYTNAALLAALNHLSFGSAVASAGTTQTIGWTWDPSAANLHLFGADRRRSGECRNQHRQPGGHHRHGRTDSGGEYRRCVAQRRRP